MLISLEGTRKNQLEQGQESMMDAALLPPSPLIRNPRPKTNSVLEHCR